ncbi:adenylate/guanylate cyclase domain-containing protein [Variovorax sp. J22P168]|uniref:CHASE2 domain-containing protein n=1 Tax=Variovorax jilinensis TaxID=3053513 RepID=UPI0025778E07|nr:adenylate/guanylate cyclase domain-containing protein [Variovorax sp. J22P168]MDM0014137.1 adenylate/guanylate cyclase domain-containing protein [Variovorax sp. J22P168]
MNALRRHGARIAITLLPVAIAIAHVLGIWQLPFIERLDRFVYDVRLRATMPETLDPRIVIVDIDDASLEQLGQWPWSRDQLARLTTEIMERQQARVLGFDVLFVEADRSSGLAALRQWIAGPLRDQPGLAEKVERLAPELDHDGAFARALAGRDVALGFFFTRSAVPRSIGQLPAPVLAAGSFPDGRTYATHWNGFAGSIPDLARAAPLSGFLNVVLDRDLDGVVRSVPLIARYQGAAAEPGYYESLALAVHRVATDLLRVVPVFAPPGPLPGAPPLEALMLSNDSGSARLRIPLDELASVLVPYRGAGGPAGGSFRYVAAADVLRGALAPGELKGRIVLVGATAPGLQDLRATPVGTNFPGVEVHANIISGLLDSRIPGVPDYAVGYELVMLVVAGLALAVFLSMSRAPRAVAVTLLICAGLIGLNSWLYLSAGLVLPLAGSLVTVALAFVLNMSWGYFVEARASRGLARLFGTYVPPQLVKEMLADPGRYSMRAQNRELTVMFCDMRGFTRMAEQMAPGDLQDFLNTFFSRLSEIISAHRGTVDKYMGDCVMAFWGAPVEADDHAEMAVRAAIEMVAAVEALNRSHGQRGLPQVKVGIGINTGLMSVGDMGSAVRRSYTVVGDAVNLASRLEGLGVHYGVEIVASASTRAAARSLAWQELDSVGVQGKARTVRIFTPVGPKEQTDPRTLDTLLRWEEVLVAYRRQDWLQAQAMLAPLMAADAEKVLYRLYAQRLASMSLTPEDSQWDGATRFDSK